MLVIYWFISSVQQQHACIIPSPLKSTAIAAISSAPNHQSHIYSIPTQSTMPSVGTLNHAMNGTITKAPKGDNLSTALTIFVAGATGDLAKTKTYPTLFTLFTAGHIPSNAIIVGYARSQRTYEEFRATIRKSLHGCADTINAFLARCFYHYGTYDDASHFGSIFTDISAMEAKISPIANRLFYFATPPNMFARLARAIKSATENKGWSRFIIEKPFGRDLESFNELDADISQYLTEEETFRIEHHAGHEMVQNLLVMRFANAMFEPLWNRRHIASVTITFKEDIGVDGKGGLYNRYGVLRDVVHTHLLQVLAMVAMEAPVAATGEDIRAEKLKVLRCIEPASIDDCVLGQYTGRGQDAGFADDEGVPEDSTTPTFAALALYVSNSRWEGVPFIIRAGKALNERKTEVRIQFRSAPGGSRLFGTQPRNELVMRIQPDEALYLKTLVKQPGLAGNPVVSELDLSYKTRFEDKVLSDAYTRLVLLALRGDTAAFIRDDEMRESWRVLAPVLEASDEGTIEPTLYRFGSRGPKEADRFAAKLGYVYHGKEYKWSEN